MKGYAFPAGFLMSMSVLHITRREQLDVGDEIFIAALSVLSIIMGISMKPECTRMQSMFSSTSMQYSRCSLCTTLVSGWLQRNRGHFISP